MTDRRPILNLQRRRHVKTLERRLKYLNDVLEEPNSEGSHAWDQAEIAALNFALRTIKAHYQEGTPENDRTQNPLPASREMVGPR